MRKFRKNDDVIVTTGRDKGKRGNITRVLTDEKVIVENVAMVKRHTKPNPNRGVAGGIVEKESAIHVSNIAHFNPVTKKADRVGFRVLEDGKKVRFFKSNNEVLDS